MFNVRATYQREAEKAMTHLATLGMNRIAVLYADDSFGADGVAGAQKGLDAARLQPVVLDKFNRAQPDFAPLAARIAQAQAQAVLDHWPGTTVADGYAALRKAGSTAQLVTLSNNASSGFIKSLGEQARGVIVSQVFPNERSLAYPLVKEALELSKAGGQGDISPAMLEGFAAAKVLVEGLRRAGPAHAREDTGGAGGHTAVRPGRPADFIRPEGSHRSRLRRSVHHWRRRQVPPLKAPLHSP